MTEKNPKVDAYVSRVQGWRHETEALRAILLGCSKSRLDADRRLAVEHFELAAGERVLGKAVTGYSIHKRK